MFSSNIIINFTCCVADSVGELAQYAELFVENDINGKRCACMVYGESLL